MSFSRRSPFRRTSQVAAYKQATKGDVTGERPGGFDFVAAAKYDAWSEVKGITADAAMQRYIDVVTALKG